MLEKQTHARLGKEPSEIKGGTIAGAHTELGRVVFPVPRMKDPITPNAAGRVLRRVLPQRE